MSRLAVSLLLALGLLLGLLTPPPAHADPIDPQALVGHWAGDWVGGDGRFNGAYELTIEKVEGDKVIGTGRFEGQKKVREFKVRGTLRGDKLTFAQTELTVSGETMTGTEQKIRTITLRKYK